MRVKRRCQWCGDDPLYREYHDREWGAPLHDDARLFELLCLEGAQAGLSWITILKKRGNYRAAFDRFDAAKMARYDRAKVAALLRDAGIVRNKLKVHAFIANARAYLALRDGGRALDAFLWNYVDGRPLQNNWKSPQQVPAWTPLSKQLARDLKKLGFAFVGRTICYALMQACGMVNDHTTDCHRHRELGGRR
ncbi:MAG: DNA-3-methyladenine glycosylase I [Gammaproteobacteria bacterium]